jgi:MFS family permease
MPIAGSLSDRWSRYRILIVTQSLAMALTLVLAGVALAGVVTVWHLVAIGALLGVVGALDVPARQAFVADMVESRDDVGNAVALHASVTNAARLLGPSIGGAIVARAGEGVCFLVNGASYAAVLLALLAMRAAPEAPARPATPILQGLRETARYARSTRPIGAILLLVALVTLLGRPYTVLLPVFAAEVLHGGPQTLGWLMAASGGGALVGTLALSLQRSLGQSARTIGSGAAVAGAALVLFALSDALWLSLALMFVTGLGVMIQLASSNARIQTLVADDKRGRIMGLYTMAFVGLAPVGTLLAGALAASLGAARMVLLGGFCCLAGSLAFGRRR